MSNTTLTSSFSPEILQEFKKYNLIQDRLAGDILALPHDFYDIKIKVNDYVVSETINYSLEKLYINSLYILSKSVIPSNNIPETKYYKYFVNDDGSGLAWKNLSQWNPVNYKNNGLTGVNKILKIDNIANPANYNIIATTTTNVILLSGTGVTTLNKIVNPDLPGIVSDSDITHPSNGVTFQNIKDITLSQSNDLFVLDNNLGTIFKFDISGILTLDDAILKNDTPGRLMTGMMGNIGSLTDKTGFINPVTLTSVNDLIYVVDHDEITGASMIKVYDSELNWKHSHSVGQTLSAGPVDIKYNPDTREIFVLCHTTTYTTLATGINNVSNSMPQIVRFDIDTMQLTQTNNFFATSKHGTSIGSEIFKALQFSLENPNIMYILSNRNMYKKYVSRPELFVGNFLFAEKNIGTGDTNTMDLQDFTIQQTSVTIIDENTNGSFTETRDEIFMLDREFETIHKFLEASNYQKSLQSDIETNFIPYNSLKIEAEELVSVFVYNKALLKSLYNNVLILENISRVFTTIFNNVGISKYIGFTYLMVDELKLLTYDQTMDNLIGVNEPVLTSTVNRCLSKIYDLQTDVLDLVQEKSINVYPLIDEPVELT